MPIMTYEKSWPFFGAESHDCTSRALDRQDNFLQSFTLFFNSYSRLWRWMVSDFWIWR